jgi:hypothetical protein
MKENRNMCVGGVYWPKVKQGIHIGKQRYDCKCRFRALSNSEKME